MDKKNKQQKNTKKNSQKNCHDEKDCDRAERDRY